MHPQDQSTISARPPSPAATPHEPTRTSRTPTNQCPHSHPGYPASAATHSAAWSPQHDRRRPCVDHGQTPPALERGADHPANPPHRRRPDGAAPRSTRSVWRRIQPEIDVLHQLQYRIINTRFGSQRQQPTTARAGDLDLHSTPPRLPNPALTTQTTASAHRSRSCNRCPTADRPRSHSGDPGPETRHDQPHQPPMHVPGVSSSVACMANKDPRHETLTHYRCRPGSHSDRTARKARA